MTLRAAARTSALAATLLGVCAMPGVHAQLPAPNSAVGGADTPDKPAHPLLAPIIHQLRFGFYQPTVSRDERSMQLVPSADPRDFSGRYSPQEATLLLPGERGRMASYTDRGARTFLNHAQEYLAGRLRADPPGLCKPEGPVRALNQGSPVQILQSPAQLTTIYMTSRLVRRIRLGSGNSTMNAPAAHPSDTGRATRWWSRRADSAAEAGWTITAARVANR